jgi:two-component system, NtrC family, response regulator AtoC
MQNLNWNEYEVVVVDDEPDNLDAFRFAFRKSFRIHYAQSGAEALALLQQLEAAVVVADQRMPGMSGIELLAAIKERAPDTHGILLTAYAEMQVLIDAVNGGAVDRYIQKPWDRQEIAMLIKQGIAHFATRRENRRLRRQLAEYVGHLEARQHDPLDFGQFQGGHPATDEILARVAEVAPTLTPVLLQGEGGLEKDLVARAVHIASPREAKPLIHVTCAAFQDEGLERELFGYEQGAFSGALSERVGRVELADGGSLFLEEAQQLSPSLQARLLRLLRSGEVERMGATKSRSVDLRLIVSVTPDVDALGKLLPDLQAQLAVFPIQLKPLRERPADIASLARHFLRQYGMRNGKASAELSVAGERHLEAYAWPDNVRELRAVVERGAIACGGGRVEPRHLTWPRSAASELDSKSGVASGRTNLNRRLEAMERSELLAALAEHNGNKAEVARALGIHRTTLYYRLKKHAIEL